MIDKDFCTETKIVGVTKLNDHNIPIQSLLPSLKEGDRIILIRDYGNEYDENAIKIYNRDGNHIGYLSASLAENISPFLEENPKYDIEGVVRCITGGADGKSYGCNITIWIQDPDEPSFEELHAFARNFRGTDSQESKNAKNANEAQFRKNQAIIDKEIKATNSKLAVFLITVIISCLVLIGGILLIMYVLGYDFSTDMSNSEKGSQQSFQERGIDEHLITLNEYNQLRSGMSRSEVYDIVGSFGEKLSETGNASDDYHIEMYSYEGYGNTGANAQLMFINGKLDTMAQYGLESYYGKEYGGENIDENTESTTEKSKPEISLEDFNIKFKKLSPDIIGYYRMTVQYENKSKYTVNSASFKVSCNGEEMLFYCDEQVKPNNKSEVHESITGSEIKINSYNIIESSFKFQTDNGEEYYFVYDYNTKKASIF